jgi:CubicO group peptidase (beta-lactamase class C family)
LREAVLKAPAGRAGQPANPGSTQWQQVPPSRVASDCHLSPRLLAAADRTLGLTPYAIYRYGRLCWTGGDKTARNEPHAVNSSTKTFTAVLFGLIATRMHLDENTLFRDVLPPTWYAEDPGSLPLAGPPPNPNAKIFHALTSTGHNPLLDYGKRLPWSYETVGNRGMNGLVKLMDKVVRDNPTKFPGSKSARDVAYNELFKPLGMTKTFWDGSIAAGGMTSTVYDMGKLGELLLRKGRWGNRQLVDEDYVYRMTHPQIEDVHTGYGYLTWLNSAAGVAALFDFKTEPVCSPFVEWRKYPHAPTFEAPDSNGGAPFKNKYDIGVFWADGAGGQFTYVHRGLDLVMVIMDDEAAQENDPEAQKRGEANVTGLEYHRMWRLVRPALIAMDPKFKGNEAAFCRAYRSGSYAPDLLSAWGPTSGFGKI